ncbi:permease, partial [Vibrio xuii]
MDWINSLALFFGSFVSNTLASLSGVGAGLLQFPLLIFFGLPFSVALATHKVSSVALGLGAAFTHIKQKSFSPKVAAYLVVVGSIGVVIGANIVLYIPE